MPAADVKIIWDDQSQIPTAYPEASKTVDYPVLMTVFSADKGPEEWKERLDYNTFKEYYGETPSFYRHGQVLVQAHDACAAGARLTCKRVVAEDATLANLGVVAKVEKDEVHLTGTGGLPLYQDADGNPTTDSTITGIPCKTTNINISFQLVSVVLSNTNSMSTFANTFYAANKHQSTPGNDDQYALFLIADNGRGFSNKRFRIYRDTSRSAPVLYVRYFLEIQEDGVVLETLPFTMNPDIIEKNHNMGMSDVVLRRSHQVRAVVFEDEFAAFTENVSQLAQFGTNEYAYADCLFGTDFYGNKYTNLPNGGGQIVINNTPINLSTVYGLQLLNGSNGTFGDRPIVDPTYPIMVGDAFDGSFDDCIYDLDNNRIDAVFDADYPPVVKRKIEELVNFREDCMFFEDMGLNIRCIDDIKFMFSTQAISRSRFVALYINSYDVYDPYTCKQINVTVMYNLARLFVRHFINGRSRPFCGQKYQVVVPTDSMIPGTLNFAPKRTPSMNQKEELDALRVNYACMFEGSILAVASEYTSQEEYTQLSFINNVLSVQEVIKAIRVVCPKIRYSFIDEDSDDFARYKEDINNMIIAKYANRFKSCTIEYVTDELYTLNKIVYAIIKVRFRDFVQTEYFKITALI